MRSSRNNRAAELASVAAAPLTPERRTALRGILDNLSEHVAAARAVEDLTALRRVQTAMHYALYDIGALVTEAENETPEAVEAALATQALELHP